MQRDTVVFLADKKRQSQEAILEQLFAEHGHVLRRFLHARLNDDETANDIVQDVFVRIAQVSDLAKRVKEDKGSIRSYLFTIANNLIIDQARRAKVRQQYLQNYNPEDDVCQITPERQLAGEQNIEKMKTVIVKLKPKYQRAFLLSRFQHWRYNQIAEEMNVSVKSVEYYIGKALAALKQEMQK